MFAEGPLESAALSGQCLQAGAVRHSAGMDKMPKWISGWSAGRRASLVTLEDCDQHPQQDWADDNGQLTGMFGDLSVILLKKRIIPVVQRGRSLFKAYPVSLQQGRLVFTDRTGELRCLIPKERFHFAQATLDECKNTSELDEQSSWLYAMPPDPGEEGLVGLAGVDADQDGVRDDVQRFIAITVQNESPEVVEAINTMAAVKQKELTNAFDKHYIVDLLPESIAAIDCYLYRTDNDPNNYGKRIEAKFYNTIERLKAWNKINSYYGGMVLTVPDDLESQCDFNR